MLRVGVYDNDHFEGSAAADCADCVPSFLTILHTIEHCYREWIGHDFLGQGEIEAVLAEIQEPFLLPPRDDHLAALCRAVMLRVGGEDPVNSWPVCVTPYAGTDVPVATRQRY